MGLVGAVLALAAPWVAAAPARADEQPSILKAYGLDWIERVRDDAWPQPKTQRPVICLLDTGVAVTPDTPADDPNGSIVARLAIDGGDGLPQGTTFEHLHGTTMAAVMTAPRNGYGTVGVFPQGRVVSVRVTEGDATYITPSQMLFGTRTCRRWAIEAGLSIASVVMAESRYDQRQSDVGLWTTAASDTAAMGGVFVAAAGNDPSAIALPPATATNVLTVSAGADGGELCSFAQPEPPTGLRGPGCSAQTSGGIASWPTGSSAATASLGAFAGALASLKPGTSAGDLAEKLRSGSVSGPRFSGQAGMREFEALLAPIESTPAAPSPTGALPTTTATSVTPEHKPDASPVIRAALWRPLVSIVRQGDDLLVRRRDRHGGTLVVVETKTAHVLGQFLGARGRLKAPAAGKRISVWATSADGRSWRSLTRRVTVPK